MRKSGNCYERAFNALNEGLHNDLLVEDNPLGEMRLVLVHGFPRLTAESSGFPKGTKYGHAWLELIVRLTDGTDCTMQVVDCGCFADSERAIIPHFIYYGVGKIEKPECHRYELREARLKVVEFEHFGHWIPEDQVPARVRYSNDGS